MIRGIKSYFQSLWGKPDATTSFSEWEQDVKKKTFLQLNFRQKNLKTH